MPILSRKKLQNWRDFISQMGKVTVFNRKNKFKKDFFYVTSFKNSPVLPTYLDYAFSDWRTQLDGQLLWSMSKDVKSKNLIWKKMINPFSGAGGQNLSQHGDLSCRCQELSSDKLMFITVLADSYSVPFRSGFYESYNLDSGQRL